MSYEVVAFGDTNNHVSVRRVANKLVDVYPIIKDVIVLSHSVIVFDENEDVVWSWVDDGITKRITNRNQFAVCAPRTATQKELDSLNYARTAKILPWTDGDMRSIAMC